MDTKNNIRQTSAYTPNDSTDQSSSSNTSSPIRKSTKARIQRNNSRSSESKVYSISERLSSSSNRVNCGSCTSRYEMTDKHFYEAFNEPISNQQRDYFRQMYGCDLLGKTYTVDEFCHLLVIKRVLGKYFLGLFNPDQAYETDQVSGEIVFRIVRCLWNLSTPFKIFILFELFNVNNTNRISINETRSVFERCLTELGIFKDKNRLNEAIDAFLQVFFPVNNETQQQELNFDRFYEVFEQNPNISESLKLIGLPDPNRKDENDITWCQQWFMYTKNNATRLSFRILYTLIVISLIIYKVVSLIDQPVWHIIARVGGILINFNFALSIFLMLKQLMTIIRRIYFLRVIIPVDDHIDAHRFIGKVLAISTIIHTIGHIVYFAIYTDMNSWIESIFTTAAGKGWVGNSAPITGVILLVFLMIMIIFALQCIRERPGFYKAFYYTHLLFWPIVVLLIIHAKDFWKWIIGPMSLFVIEKVYLLRRHVPKHGRTNLIAVRIEDDNTLTLFIERPKHFRFHTGDYVNICFPNIARMEWHPFTISSAPEREDILRINIKKKKNWTKKVYNHFYKRLNDLDNNNELTEVAVDAGRNHTNLNSRNILLPKEIKFSPNDKDAIICVEGPFSSCTSYIFDCEHVVVIGAGIGITPYISVLESIIHRIKKQRCNCTRCDEPHYDRELTCQKLKKVDFIWVTRDIKNFSWFQSILNKFENEQELYLNSSIRNTTDEQVQRSRYLDIHLYCTSLKTNEQAMLGNFFYDCVTNMYEYRQGKDIHTQLRTRTQVGRPSWRSLFNIFKSEHKSTNVFFTGSRTMGDEIKDYCNEFGFQFRQEPGFQEPTETKPSGRFNLSFLKSISVWFDSVRDFFGSIRLGSRQPPITHF